MWCSKKGPPPLTALPFPSCFVCSGDGLRLPLPAPAEQTEAADAGSEQRKGGGHRNGGCRVLENQRTRLESNKKPRAT
jgi:hypothetical protein